MNKFLSYTCIILLISCVIGIFYWMGYLIVGEIKRNHNIIVKQDSEYMWVKEYSIYNEDSYIYKYHQPIIYEGVISSKKCYFRGVGGKGGHMIYETHIKYNNDKKYVETGLSYYSNHNEGDKVNIKVTFYPWKKTEILE